jgi:hypothetical protein
MTSADSSIRAKPPLQYIGIRAYAATAVLLSIALGLLHSRLADAISFWIDCLIGALLLTAGVIVYDVFFIPFDYTMMGRLRRTPVPTDEKPIERSQPRWLWHRVSIGFSIFPATSPWQLALYPEGLAINLVFRNAFIPSRYFKEIRVVSNSPRWFSLEHSSPEIKSPISFADEPLYSAISNIIAGAAN